MYKLHIKGNNMLSQEDVKKVLDYDEVYGIVNTTHTLSCRPGGYPMIQIGGSNWRLKDILYVYLHGALPTDAIVVYDNGNRSDHRAKNLVVGYTYNQKRKIASDLYKQQQKNKQNLIYLSDSKAKRHLNKQARHKRRVTGMFDKM